MIHKKKLIIITGPTASGKSALAISLARRLQTQIISADSRQIYKGIPIVTASPSTEELSAVRHHLVGILPLDAYYSASEFEQDALRILENIWADNEFAIVCGGSMMYLDALCNGIDTLPTVPDHIRRGLSARHKANGDPWLLGELQRLDPEYYEKVDRKNIKRVFHAVEVSITAGAPYSSLLTGEKVSRNFEIYKFALTAPREILFGRINSRVVSMMESGLEDEARRLSGLRHLNSLNTVGMKEMFAYFDGLMTRDKAVARIQKNTRVYAKKQLAWFRRDSSVRWIDFTQCDPLKHILSDLCQKS